MDNLNVASINTPKPVSHKKMKSVSQRSEAINMTDSFTPGSTQTDSTTDLKKAAKSLLANSGYNMDAAWVFQAKDNMSVSPMMGNDGTIFTGDEKGNIYAINGKTGETLWERKFDKDAKITAITVGGSDNLLFVGANNKKVRALNPKTGKLVWEGETGMKPVNSLLITKDHIVAKSFSNVYIMDIKTGEEKKHYNLYSSQIPYVFFEPAATPDGMMIAGGDTKSVFKLDPATGEYQWNFDAKVGVTRAGAAVGPDGTTYFGCGNHKFYAVDKDGNKKWEYEKTRYGNEYYEIYNRPAVGPDGTVYVRSSDHYLYAFDGQTGEVKWQEHTGEKETGYSAPVGIDTAGNVFTGNSDGRIRAFDGKTGKKTGEYKADQRIYPTLSFAPGQNGLMHISSCDKIYAVGVGIESKENQGEQGEGATNRDNLTIEQGKGFVNIGGVKLRKQEPGKE